MLPRVSHGLKIQPLVQKYPLKLLNLLLNDGTHRRLHRYDYQNNILFQALDPYRVTKENCVQEEYRPKLHQEALDESRKTVYAIRHNSSAHVPNLHSVVFLQTLHLTLMLHRNNVLQYFRDKNGFLLTYLCCVLSSARYLFRVVLLPA